MKMRKRLWRSLALCGLAATLALTGACSSSNSSSSHTPSAGVYDEDLQFDDTSGTAISVTLSTGGVDTTLNLTKYTVTYVANPIEMATEYSEWFFTGSESTVTLSDVYSYQKMNIYVPDTADQDSAIIFAVNNSGWATHPVSESIVDGNTYETDSDTDRVGAALAAGYVFIDVGTRGRNAYGADDTWQGKAPAVVVDAKAAIRYLRLNDDAMSGSTDKIVITGTSGGGGLSTVIAASGNSPDYYPYLQEIGAAGITSSGGSTLDDDVFAVIAYCPITDLGHADIAYEWQYGDLRAEGDPLGGPAGFLPWIVSNLTADMLTLSPTLAGQYPAYLDSLGLTFLDENNVRQDLSSTTMETAITTLVKAGVQKALDEGVAVPVLGANFSINGVDYENTWVAHDGTTVSSVDYDAYLVFVKTISALKGVPSFDVTGTVGIDNVGSGESNLFGSPDYQYSNFTQWTWDNNEFLGDGSGPDDNGGLLWAEYISGSELENQLKLINPIVYLTDDSNGDKAPYWYVRHGLIDRDTAFAIEAELFNAIENNLDVAEVNYALAYLQNHGGNYDVQEAYAWLASILAD